jgi:hypothetical protein
MAGADAAQGTGAGTSQTPQAPPIPVAPSRPGAGTGATAAQGAGGAGGAAAGLPATVQPGQEQGTPQAVIVQPPPYRDRIRDNDIPREVIPIVGIVFGTLMMVALGYPIIRTITRLIERRSDKAYVRGADVEVQLRALQESVDTMAIEIERISESQRFQSKLLAERKQDALGSG